MTGTITAADLSRRVGQLLDAHHWSQTDRLEFLRQRFDAGLAWVHFPDGLGGCDALASLQRGVDKELRAAGAPDNKPRANVIGLGMAAPTLLRHGTRAQQDRYLRPLWTGEEIWCQLFSEPGAGSDLASVTTKAVRDGDHWVVTGQKVWTSFAHTARRALLLARTDMGAHRHRGLTYFVLDMHQPEVEVRPLRQITGEAEFNEVFMTGARISDADRVGDVGGGWPVAMTTLSSERVVIGDAAPPREGGSIAPLVQAWRERPERRTWDAHGRLLRIWVEAEALRLNGLWSRQQRSAGSPGPEGSANKLRFAQLAQAITALELDLAGADGLRYDDWAMRRPAESDFLRRGPSYRYLRARGLSIEGGTSEILRNIIGERVLGLPAEPKPAAPQAKGSDVR